MNGSRLRLLCAGATVTASLAAFGGSAGAMAPVGTNVYSAGGVSGVCSYVTTLPGPDFNHLRVELKYDVTAQPLNGTAVAFAVNGTCAVWDFGVTPHKYFGEVSAFGVGPVGTGAGEVLVDRLARVPVTCNTPQALYTDGSQGNQLNRYQCTPI